MSDLARFWAIGKGASMLLPLILFWGIVPWGFSQLLLVRELPAIIPGGALAIYFGLWFAAITFIIYGWRGPAQPPSE